MSNRENSPYQYPTPTARIVATSKTEDRRQHTVTTIWFNLMQHTNLDVWEQVRSLAIQNYSTIQIISDDPRVVPNRRLNRSALDTIVKEMQAEYIVNNE